VAQDVGSEYCENKKKERKKKASKQRGKIPHA
jgi:hypothetical protein